jgi:hypothetical protein
MSEVKLVSVDKQRKKITVTPTGWVVIAVAGLLVVAGVGWGVWKITKGVSVQPLAAAPEVAPTVEPTAVPTVVEDEGDTVPDLTQVEELARLREHFLEAWMWRHSSEVPHNLDEIGFWFAPFPSGIDDPLFQPGGEWWDSFETVRAALDEDASEGRLWRVVVTDGEWETVLERSGPGWAVVAGQYKGGSCRVEAVNTATGALDIEAEGRCMRYVASMVWDMPDQRWKIVNLGQFEPAGAASGDE